MSNKIRQICSRLFLVCVMAVLVPFQSFAATARIAFSDPSAQVGQEVSVTMKFSTTDGTELGNTDVMLAYDATALEYINETENASGGNGAIRVWSAPQGATEAATQLRFRALKAGTTQITITSWEGYDNDGQTLTVEREGTSTITVAGLETSSNDARLQSLQVYPGTLDPAFSPDTTTYTTSVGLDVTRLTIDAIANNDNATVEVEGGSDLQDGENTVVCRVTAEDGTTVNSYTITVNKVEGGASEEGNAGESEGGETEAANTPEILAELDVLAKKIRIIAVPDGVQVPAGLKESSIAIGDARIQGWTSASEEQPQYCVFYGMNENDEQNFYRYDLTDKTVQRLFAEDMETASPVDPELETRYNGLYDSYNRILTIAVVLGAAAGVLLIVVIILMVLLAKRKSARVSDEEYEEPEQSQEVRKTSRRAGGRKLSKEERYMMGEEDEFAEEDPEAYMPETVIPEAGSPEAEQLVAVELKEDPELAAEIAPEAAPDGQVPDGQPSARQNQVEDVELAITRNLAKEAVAAAREPVAADEEDDEDDFEVFDLDDDDDQF